MALGSPSHDSPQKPTYLPGFLLGERAQSPVGNVSMGNVSMGNMSPLRASRSQTADAHTTFLMRNFHHELSDKPYVKSVAADTRHSMYVFVCCYRSSTPILNRVTEEPAKAPTIDLFDMLNTSDYREEPYVLLFLFRLQPLSNCSPDKKSSITGAITKKRNSSILKKTICLNRQKQLQDIGSRFSVFQPPTKMRYYQNSLTWYLVVTSDKLVQTGPTYVSVILQIIIVLFYLMGM